MTLTFLAPGFLWALAVVPFLWFVPRRVTDVGHGLIRSALIAALVLGLARPVLLDNDAAARHIIILDRTASLSSDGDARARAVLDRLMSAIPNGAETTVIELSSDSRNPTATGTPAEVPTAPTEVPAPAADAHQPTLLQIFVEGGGIEIPRLVSHAAANPSAVC